MPSIFFHILFIISIFFSCQSPEEANEPQNHEHLHHKGEYIYRQSHEQSFQLPKITLNSPPSYPWDKKRVGTFPRISKEYFRCKGNHLNPVLFSYSSNGEEQPPTRIQDCSGSAHSLPISLDEDPLAISQEKEFIYPILIKLLNYIQEKTEKQVIITCGHRCPKHNTYSDTSKQNRYSKHMIGAEVDFYIQGLENYPQNIVNLLMKYFKENPEYKDQFEFTTFQRYQKQDTNASTLPWFNKEIFIKLLKKHEGRDFDNRHTYPYISIQVRHDKEKKKNVSYNWNQAYRGFLKG